MKPPPWSKLADAMYRIKAAANGRAELALELGVSVESLELLGVGVGFDSRFGRFWSFPERDARRQAVGIKKRYADGTKVYMRKSKPGLYIVKDWWTYGGPLFLPEGGSDVAALLTMRLCAIGRASCLSNVEYLIGLLREWKRPVVVLGENDRKPKRVGSGKRAGKDAEGMRLCASWCTGCMNCWPGKYGAKETAYRLSDALGRPVGWRIMRGAKDSRQWLEKNGADGDLFIRQMGRS